MVSRRFILALVASALLLPSAVEPTLAKRPQPEPGEERPLTAQEQAASDHKVAAAEAYVAGVEAAGGDLVSLACVTPTSTEAKLVATACVVPQGFLAVEARDQIGGTYCGPAVGQVIANYSWAMPAGANKYTQKQIAIWMSTDVNGQTGAFALEAGLENATWRSPRRPANWDWIVTNLWDSDRDGMTGDQLQNFVRSNISGSRMPLAIPLKPHDPNSTFYLASWPRPVNSVGHWITVYGWVGTFNGTDSARIYYTDSSKDEGGATGKFWNPTRHIAALIGEHTRRFVW